MIPCSDPSSAPSFFARTRCLDSEARSLDLQGLSVLPSPDFSVALAHRREAFNSAGMHVFFARARRHFSPLSAAAAAALSLFVGTAWAGKPASPPAKRLVIVTLAPQAVPQPKPAAFGTCCRAGKPGPLTVRPGEVGIGFRRGATVIHADLAKRTPRCFCWSSAVQSPRSPLSCRPCGARVITSWAMGTESEGCWKRGSGQIPLGMSANRWHSLASNSRSLIPCNIEGCLVGIGFTANLR